MFEYYGQSQQLLASSGHTVVLIGLVRLKGTFCAILEQFL